MLLAQIMGQITVGWGDAIVIYGPLGIGWVAGAALINKLMALHKEREAAMERRETARDSLIRETMSEQAAVYSRVVHELSGVKKYLLFLAATHSDKELNVLAKTELAKIEAAERPGD